MVGLILKHRRKRVSKPYVYSYVVCNCRAEAKRLIFILTCIIFQNLDIQYTVGLATNVPTTFITVGANTQDGPDDGFLDTINALLNETSPPLVLTTR